MIELFRLFLWFVVTLVIGRSAIAVIFHREPHTLFFTERAALSYGLGLGLVSIEMALLSLFGIRFGIFSITVFWLPLVFVAVLISIRNGKKESVIRAAEGSGNMSLFEKFLVSCISLEALYAFFRALIKPIESYDSIAIYALKSKIFYLARGVPRNFFSDFKDFVPHIEYPLLLPLSETYLYTFLGNLNDLLVKIIFPLFFIAILAVFYSIVRRQLARRYALLFTFLLATVPQFKDYATIGYADIMLTFYYSASFFYLFLWMKNRRTSLLILSFVLSVLGMWTKTEGFMLAGINAAIAIFFIWTQKNARTKALISYICALLMGMAGYVLAKRALGLSLHGDFAKLGQTGPAELFLNLKRIPRILYEYQRQFFGPKKWNIIWILVIFAFAANMKKALSNEMAPATLSIFLVLSGYAFIYVITPQDIGWHLSTTASRFFIHFLPVAVLWLALLFRDAKLEI